MDMAEGKIPVDQLAQMDTDQTVLFFGIVPLVVIGVLALLYCTLYFVRRKKNWQDLGEAMKIDEGDKPVDASGDDGFSSRDIAEMDPTKPSQRLAKNASDH